MSEAISQFFVNTFGDNVWLAVFLIAIIPLIELKGAIPFGMSSDFWGANALSPWMALLISFLGSIVVVPIIALVFNPIINWLDKYKFFHAIINFFTEGIKNKSQSIEANQNSTPSDEKKQTSAVEQNANPSVGMQENKTRAKSIIFKMLSVIMFVAFPVPLTGVWTGTCFAALLRLNFWQTCLSVILGNFICGLLVTFICCIFPSATAIIFYIFIAILIVALIIKIVLHIFNKKNKI